MSLRVLELFAGAGGMALGFHRAGLEPVALAEWDQHAQCVLRARFLGVPLYGDVREVDGKEIVAQHGRVDLVSFGAPCQDLSVAGKRAGLDGDRSSLFHEGIRLWEETGATYALYENVCGALSSHAGADFARVLSAFVGRTVSVPVRGWGGRARGGVVSGPAGVAAWRILDAQYFGVPQRRRRVFVLGARPGGVSPEFVLLEPEGVCWDHAAGGEAGEGVTGTAAGGAGAGGDIVGALDTECGYTKATFQSVPMGHIVPALPASGAGTARTGNERTEAELVVVQEATPIQTPLMVNKRQNGLGIGAPNDPMYSLEAASVHGVVQEAIPILEATSRQGKSGEGSAGIGKPGDPMFTLQATQQHGVFQEAVAFAQNQLGEVRVSDTMGTLAVGGGIPGQGYSAVLQPEACYPIDTRNATRTTEPSEQNRQGVGVGKDGDPSPTITGAHVPAVAHLQPKAVVDKQTDLADEGIAPTLKTDLSHQMGPVVAPTLSASNNPSRSPQSSEVTQQVASVLAASPGRPRRLMPVECERLMGWPDDHTLVLDPKGKPMADSHRYKMCGNGVVSHVAEWIGRRLIQADALAELSD